MAKFCAFCMGWQLHLGDPKFDMVVGKRPYINGPGAYPWTPKRFVLLESQCADDPDVGYPPKNTWTAFINLHDLWLYNSSTGAKYDAWNELVHVIDWSIEGIDWAGATTDCLAAARLYADHPDIYFDDAGTVPFPFASGSASEFNAAEKLRFAEHMLEASESIRGEGCMLNGSLYWSKPTSMVTCYGYVKMEGFRFLPDYGDVGGWSGQSGSEFVWSDWWSGNDKIRGITELQALGITPVIEASYGPTANDPGPDWSAAKIEAYANICVATAMLADCYLAFHEQRNWAHPNWSIHWTEAHRNAVLLGDPLDAAPLELESGFWQRAYYGGMVYVNSTAGELHGIAAYSGAIVPTPEPLPGPQPAATDYSGFADVRLVHFSLNNDTDYPDTLLTDYIQRFADPEIDAYLRPHGVTVPITPVPDVIRNISALLAAAHALMNRSRTPYGPRGTLAAQLWKDAHELLRKVTTGEFEVGLVRASGGDALLADAAPDTRPGSQIYVTREERAWEHLAETRADS